MKVEGGNIICSVIGEFDDSICMIKHNDSDNYFVEQLPEFKNIKFKDMLVMSKKINKGLY